MDSLVMVALLLFLLNTLGKYIGTKLFFRDKQTLQLTKHLNRGSGDINHCINNGVNNMGRNNTKQLIQKGMQVVKDMKGISTLSLLRSGPFSRGHPASFW
jgi:hypothetical protein